MNARHLEVLDNYIKEKFGENFEIIEKKDARILWSREKCSDGILRIDWVKVSEFSSNHNPQWLYKSRTMVSDSGNCFGAWKDNWSTFGEILSIYVGYQFMSPSIEQMFWVEMMKIKEIRYDVAFLLYRIDGFYENIESFPDRYARREISELGG
jgi:hypothetical protein